MEAFGWPPLRFLNRHSVGGKQGGIRPRGATAITTVTTAVTMMGKGDQGPLRPASGLYQASFYR